MSGNPYAPSPRRVVPQLDVARLRRLGADDGQVASAQAAFDALGPAERENAVAELAVLTDREAAQRLGLGRAATADGGALVGVPAPRKQASARKAPAKRARKAPS